MMRSIWGISLIVLWAAPALADTLLHQQIPGRTFGISSDTLYVDDFGRITGALIADKFNLMQPSDTSICRVVVYAFFGGTDVVDPGPPSSEMLRVRFLSEAGGLPSEPSLYEAVFQNPSRAWTGFLINIGGARKEYVYQLPLTECFTARPGTDYWLEVAQIGNMDSLFRWENSNTAGGFAVQFPLGTSWRLTTGSGQMAYDLWTPEPCSGALLAAGVGCVLRRRKR